MTRLQFYWYETTGAEELRKLWGQLAGAIHRVRFAADELQAVLQVTDPFMLVRRVAYHAENYLVRVYELRERALTLIATACGDPRIARELKSQENRDRTLVRVGEVFPDLGPLLAEFLNEVHYDVELRNLHTHETFLAVGLVHHGEVYDPEDALAEVEGRPAERQGLEEVLRREARRLAAEYEGKAERVIRMTQGLLRLCEPALRARNP